MRWVETGPGGRQRFSGEKPVAHVLTFHPRDLRPGKPAWEWGLNLPKVPGLEMEGTSATEAEAKAAVEVVWTAWLELLGLQPIPGRT
ncbi:hypothetical protein IPV08_08270 [Methylobacterium sp. SD274]|jgi:hypothetical protein|uniref:Uncharacterized protein n=1 Tax=Methylobacterium gossipiicola TaxID=582675 RepID=A0A1I2UZK2_9HYPH|nr:hypothetical protein [Methylobacterium gossipiicola]MBO1019958.1 hypothetical protein [Methylobacterium sp. SD274]SFG82538.1 hypothetical protein SAMN05192565_112113 [Methylobacterium gossipiicola]